MSQENISLKIGLDTSNFNNSVKGMMNELRALQKVDLTLLSDQDAKRVINRMGDLKASIGDVQREIKLADPGEFFNSFSVLAGPAIAAISGLGVGMELFGAKSEEVEKIQRKLMMVISLLSTLQTIADADKLKGLITQLKFQALEIKNKLTNILLIKQETVATTAQGGAVKTLTGIQLLWNKAVAANPITAIIVGIMALVTAIVLLSKTFKNNNEEIKESEKAYDGTIIKNKELRKTYNDSLDTLRDLKLSNELLSGSITQQEFDMRSLTNSYETQIRLIDEKYLPQQEEILEKSFGVWNTIKNTFLSVGNSTNALIKNYEDSVKGLKEIDEQVRLEKEASQRIQDEKNQERILKENKRITELTNQLTNSLIEEEEQRARQIYEQRMKEIDESAAIDSIKSSARIAVEQELTKKLKDISEKRIEIEKSAREKILSDIQSFYKQSTDLFLTEQQKEIQQIEEKGELLKEALLKSFPDVNSSGYIKGLKDIDNALNVLKTNVEKKYQDISLKELFDLRKEYNLSSIKEMEDEEIKSLMSSKSFSLLSEDEKQKSLNSIRKKYIQKEIDEEKSKYNFLKSIGINVNTEMEDIELKELQSFLDQKLITEQQFEEARKNLRLKYLTEKSEMEEKEEMLRNERFNIFMEASTAALQIISDQQKSNHDNEMKRIQELYDNKKNKLDEELEYGLISQSEYNSELEAMEKKKAEEERKLKIKAARQEKLMALFSIALSTAMGVMNALSKVATAPLVPFIIASGAIQAGVVAAKPIPAYEKGTEFASGGLSLVGERGPELVELPRGSKVIPNNQLNTQSKTISYEDMTEFISVAFERYNQIPVVVSEYEISNAQVKVKTTRTSTEF